MKGLLQKDLCIMTGRSKSLLILLIVGVIMSVSTDGSFVVGYLTLLACIMAISTISYDEFDNGYPFIFSLPITRKDYVLSKYIFSILMGLFGLIVGIIFTYGISLMQNKTVNTPLYETIITDISLILLMIAIMIPLQLKFGAEKSRTMMVVIGALGYAASLLGKNLLIRYVHIDLSIVRNITDKQLMMGFVVIGCITSLLSYLISVKIINNKEY